VNASESGNVPDVSLSSVCGARNSLMDQHDKIQPVCSLAIETIEERAFRR
jgi:hypothetical protein